MNFLQILELISTLITPQNVQEVTDLVEQLVALAEKIEAQQPK